MFSEDQKQTASFMEEEGRLCLSVGSKRTGKTAASCGALFGWSQAVPEPQKFLIGGRKLRVIERELLPKFQAAARVCGLPYNYNRADNIAYIGQHEYHCIAGNDANSFDRLWGLTLYGGLVDELQRVPKNYWEAATSQLSFAGSKMWGMANPGGPLLWLKTDWLDQGKFHKHVKYHMDRAHFLAEEVKQGYRDMYSGVFYLRFYEGEWAAAEGVIYEHWTEDVPDADSRVIRTEIGVDYGVASPSALVVLQRRRTGNLTTYHVPEVVYVEEPETDRQLAKKIVELANRQEAQAVILDPSAASLRLELLGTSGRRFGVKRANNEVIPGIRLTQNALAQGKLTIGPGATKRLQDELATYAWNPDKQDTPIKENDHCCDALRYGAMSLIAHPTIGNVTLPEGL